MADEVVEEDGVLLPGLLAVTAYRHIQMRYRMSSQLWLKRQVMQARKGALTVEVEVAGQGAMVHGVDAEAVL